MNNPYISVSHPQWWFLLKALPLRRSEKIKTDTNAYFNFWSSFLFLRINFSKSVHATYTSWDNMEDGPQLVCCSIVERGITKGLSIVRRSRNSRCCWCFMARSLWNFGLSWIMSQQVMDLFHLLEGQFHSESTK